MRLVDPSREFGPSVPGQAEALRHRLDLGTVFVLNRDTARLRPADLDDRLPAATLHWPADAPDGLQAMLVTDIVVHGAHRPHERDSGLTSPRLPQLLAGEPGPGRAVRFHYLPAGPAPGPA